MNFFLSPEIGDIVGSYILYSVRYNNTSECEIFGGEPELLAAVHSSLCSSRESVNQLQLDHDTTALLGVFINWHYHRHNHSLTLASLHMACMLEIALAIRAICTVE